MLPTVHYNMGGIPTNYWGEVLNPTRGRSRPRPARPDGGGRGRLRLGARRQPARLQLADRPRGVRPRRGDPRRRGRRPRRADPRRSTRRRSRRSWTASTGCATPTAASPTAELRDKMQRDHAGGRRGVPHRRNRCRGLRAGWRRSAAEMADIKVTDRSMIWNSDLVETLELDNLMANALATVVSAPRRARRAAARMPARTSRTATTPTGASTRWPVVHPDDSVTLCLPAGAPRPADHRGRGRHRPEEDRAQGAGVLRRH